MAKDLNNSLSLTVESYYKTMKNIINYKDGASFLDIDDPTNQDGTKQDWQDKVAIGKGNSYGFEVLLQNIVSNPVQKIENLVHLFSPPDSANQNQNQFWPAALANGFPNLEKSSHFFRSGCPTWIRTMTG